MIQRLLLLTGLLLLAACGGNDALPTAVPTPNQDEATFNQAWAAGQAMSLDEAIALALEEATEQDNGVK